MWKEVPLLTPEIWLEKKVEMIGSDMENIQYL